MLNRVKQVFAAVTAKITAADINFLEQHLTAREQQLFYAMNLPDQRHALNVAYTARNLAEGRQADLALLTKCALLHDVGKVRGDVSTLDKIVAVLADKAASSAARRWGRFGRGGKLQNLRHAMYIYYNHGDRGAALLAAAGEPSSLVEMVRRHHSPAAPGDPVELVLLRQADDLN